MRREMVFARYRKVPRMTAPARRFVASIDLSVRFTDHAVRRARKRFSLVSANDARRFLLRELEEAVTSSPGHDGCTIWESARVIVVTRAVDRGTGLLVVTCYPNVEHKEHSEPRRRSRMSSPRYRERRRSVKQQVRFEVERQLSQLGYSTKVSYPCRTP